MKSVYLKISLIISFLTVGVIASLVFLSVRQQKKFFETSYTDKATALAIALDASITQKNFKDTDELQNQVHKFIWLNHEVLELSINLIDKGKLNVAVSSDASLPGKLASEKSQEAFKLDQTLSEPTEVDGVPALLVVTPVHVAGKEVGTYEMLLSTQEATESLNGQIRSFVALGFVSFLIFLVVSLVSVRLSIISPIQKLVKGAQIIAEGNLDHKVELRSRDEIGQLASVFNEMTGKIRIFYKTLEEKVKEQTNQLGLKIDEAENQNLALERTKKAMLNIMEDLSVEKVKIEREKAKDEAVLSSIGEGMVATDQDRRIILVNEVAAKLVGTSVKSLLGKKWPVISVLNKKNEPISEEDFLINKAIVTGKRCFDSSLSYKIKGGKKLPVAITSAPISLDKKTIGGIVVFRDITEERNIDKMKTEFVSLASHQLRTPLTSINWYIEMLLAGDAGKLATEQRQYLEEVYTGSTRMVRLVNDLLNVARLENGRLRIEPEPTQLETFIQDIIDEAKPLTKDKKTSLVFKKSAKKLPKVPVDPGLLRQVVHNLITNAIRYLPDDKKSDIVTTLEKKGNKNYLISVRDQGIGIPKEVQKRIFEKFFRADNARHQAAEGTGLGLYIAKLVMEDSGGKIWLESKEGKGTTFFVSIPIEGMQKKTGEKGLAA